MQKQSTSTILMVRPDHFGFNPQTAVTNPFQHTPQAAQKDANEIRTIVFTEFNTMVEKLRSYGVTVIILPSRSDVVTPDAIFPNNWFSSHQNTIVLYPMLTPNRRLERQKEALVDSLKTVGIANPEVIDLTDDEENGLILESTGSMVLDRIYKVAFAMKSARTVEEEFDKWCRLMNYEGFFIHITEKFTKEVYHTNIAMSIGSDFAIICMDVVEGVDQQKALRDKLVSLGKECVTISVDQMYAFCGNILELQTNDGKKLIVMSTTAQKAFGKDQLARLEKYGEIVIIEVPIIEEIGGGGVRCMMGEIFSSEN